MKISSKMSIELLQNKQKINTIHIKSFYLAVLADFDEKLPKKVIVVYYVNLQQNEIYKNIRGTNHAQIVSESEQQFVQTLHVGKHISTKQ